MVRKYQHVPRHRQTPFETKPAGTNLRLFAPPPSCWRRPRKVIAVGWLVTPSHTFRARRAGVFVGSRATGERFRLNSPVMLYSSQS